MEWLGANLLRRRKMYENCKIYGPYECKDGRLRIIINNVTISYPKYLMECYLNRKLTADETVDHIDKNPLNNEISNLQILSRKEHCSLDAKYLQKREFTCPTCGEKFELVGRQLGNALSNNKKRKVWSILFEELCRNIW
jgi:transcription initiation factor IIE alpha subunit